MKTACTVSTVLAMAIIQLLTATPTRAQINPPPVVTTNWVSASVDAVCLENIGGHEVYVTNTYTFGAVTNVATNSSDWYTNGLPWLSTNSWPCCEYCGSLGNLEETFWLHYQFTTGGDGRITHLGTTNLFTTDSWIFDPVGLLALEQTNSFVEYLHDVTDGNSLSFSHTLGGAQTWSGSPTYRVSAAARIYNFVRGVSTDGSKTNVHLWATNEYYMNGALYKTEQVITH